MRLSALFSILFILLSFFFISTPTNIVTPTQAASLAANTDWQPARTWVFVVGLVEWKHSETYESFPQANRRDVELVRHFRRQGVPNNHIVYLKDGNATQRRIQESFVNLLNQTRPGDTLFFYFSGHGFTVDGPTVYFASYDTGDRNVPGWSTNSIIPTIEKYFQGSRVLMGVDCCYSGYLANQVKRHRSDQIQYACLTSSTATESSTERWTFTDCLLDGLAGNSFVDLNSDGEISLLELASHTRQDMALAEEQKAAFTYTSGFDSQMIIATADQRDNPRIGERVKINVDGEWYMARIIETNGSKFKIHYIGYEDNYDEWVKENRLQSIRSTQTAQNTRRNANTRQTFTQSSDQGWQNSNQQQQNVVQNQQGFAAGSVIEVEWQGDWYPARVVKNNNGKAYIHYIGYSSEYDEWVTSQRMRQSRQRMVNMRTK